MLGKIFYKLVIFLPYVLFIISLGFLLNGLIKKANNKACKKSFINALITFIAAIIIFIIPFIVIMVTYIRAI